jgi:hypothetical protein
MVSVKIVFTDTTTRSLPAMNTLSELDGKEFTDRFAPGGEREPTGKHE